MHWVTNLLSILNWIQLEAIELQMSEKEASWCPNDATWQWRGLKSIWWELFPVGKRRNVTPSQNIPSFSSFWRTHLVQGYSFLLSRMSVPGGYICWWLHTFWLHTSMTPYLLTLYCLRLSWTQHIKHHCFRPGLRLFSKDLGWNSCHWFPHFTDGKNISETCRSWITLKSYK